MDISEYVKKQIARLHPIAEDNPHYTLQLRDSKGHHTNWMNLNAKQLEGISRALQGTATPGAQWRANGEPDPHGDRYNCERSDLAMGDLSDDELANGAFMNYDAPLNLEGIMAGTHNAPIAWMTAVKDRIRWLSRRAEEGDELRAALALCVKAIDNLLPGAKFIPADIGLVNDALIAARPLCKED